MVRPDHYDWKITPEMLDRPYNLRKSKVDGMYRKWQAFTYQELGIPVEIPDFEPTIWICTGVYEDKPDAILAHNEILRS